MGMEDEKVEQPSHIDELSQTITPKKEDIEMKRAELELKKIEFLDKRCGEIIPKIASYYEQKMIKYEKPILKTGIWVFAGIIILIVLATLFLVYIDKLDAASFTFVIGAALGYLLAFSKLFWRKERE